MSAGEGKLLKTDGGLTRLEAGVSGAEVAGVTRGPDCQVMAAFLLSSASESLDFVCYHAVLSIR